MRLKSLFLIPVLILTLTSCEELFDTLEDIGLTEGEIIQGLKEALTHGTDSAVVNLSVADGYFGDELVKILLPEEAQPVYDVLQSVPILSGLVEETVLTINRAAEDAATEAAPIFVDAITEMTIQDGLSILHGSDTAATSYLRQKTFQNLFDAFQPKIETSLSKDIVLGVSAEESYSQMIGVYNTASLNGFLWDKIESNSLSEHTTNKALKGLFVKVAKEEKSIREDPAHRVTDILEKVFAEQD